MEKVIIHMEKSENEVPTPHIYVALYIKFS